jgi:hypothetical protein
LPTDGYRMPDDATAAFGGQSYTGVNRVAPTAVQAPPVTAVVPVASVAGPVAAPGFKL